MTLPKIWTSEVLKSADLNGNFSYLDNFNNSVLTKTDNYVIPDGTSDLTVLMNASGKTVTLPDATANDYRKITIKKVISANTTVTINTTSSQTIDGVTSQTLDFVQEFMTVQSDGSNWIIINWYIPEYQYSLTVTGDNSFSPVAANTVGLITKNRSSVWKITLYIDGTTSGSTTETVTIANIVFKNGTTWYQPLASGSMGLDMTHITKASTWYNVGGGVADGSIYILSGASNSIVQVSGTAILNAKPSFVV